MTSPKVDELGMQVRVKAGVMRFTKRGKDTGNSPYPEAIHTASIVLLHLLSIDGMEVGGIETAYIFLSNDARMMRLQQRDVIVFDGYARNGADGYHFVYLTGLKVVHGELDYGFPVLPRQQRIKKSIAANHIPSKKGAVRG